METIVVALIALIGSSAAAAFIANGWLRRKYQADTLREGMQQILKAEAEYRLSVAMCAGLLRVYAGQSNRLWNYQRTKFQDAVVAANGQLIALQTAIGMSAITHPWSRAFGLQLMGAANRTLEHLGEVTFIPIERDPENNGVTIQLSGGTPREVADRVVGALDEQAVGHLIALAGNHHEQILRMWRGAVAALIMAVLVCLGLGYFAAWTYDIRPGYIVGFHRLTGEVRVIPILDTQPPTPTKP
jgi:hypothetical protein